MHTTQDIGHGHGALAAGTLRLRRCTAARAEFEQQLVRVPGPTGSEDGEEVVVLNAVATVVFLSASYKPTRIPPHVRSLLLSGRPDGGPNQGVSVME